MSARINLNDLEPAQRKALGVRKPRETDFTADDVRGHAIRCLAAIAGLTQQERDRVLRHAVKMNRLKTRE
mgnify:CR=1 FL=1